MVNSKKQVWLVTFLVFYCACAVAQIDTLKRKLVIYNHVYKNIAAYYIGYETARNADIYQDNFLTQGVPEYFFDNCLPDEGYKLQMDIKKINWNYPIKGYEVYEVYLNGFRFESSANGKTKITQSFDGPVGTPRGNYYLICINEKDDIKYISGTFFLNDVTNDFGVNKADPRSYLRYLKFRTFQMQTEQITYLSRKGRYFCYSAYSQEQRRNLQILIDPRYPSRLQIKVLKN